MIAFAPLNRIRDPTALDAELVRVRNRLQHPEKRIHVDIDYVTLDDEHHGRRPDIRRARAEGLKRARHQRVDHSREHRPGSTHALGSYPAPALSKSQTHHTASHERH